MEPIYARFGAELRRIRKTKGLTQAQLAERVGEKLGRTSIVNIEKGQQRVHVHTLFEFAAALEVQPAELLPISPDQAPEILAKAGSLPVPELDWVMRMTAPRSRRPRARKET